jgi:hypothetical protein
LRCRQRQRQQHGAQKKPKHSRLVTQRRLPFTFAGRKRTAANPIEAVLREGKGLEVVSRLQMMQETLAPGAFRRIVAGRFDQPA